MDEIRVIIADDHAILRQGIRNILEAAGNIMIVGEAHNGYEALLLISELGADILILDIEMPILGGIEVARILHRTQTPIRVLILSSYDDKYYISEALKNGVDGYVLKDEAPQHLVEAVEHVSVGEAVWVSERISAQIENLD